MLHGSSPSEHCWSFDRRLETFDRWCFGLSAHTLPALGLALLEKFTNREAAFHKASLRYEKPHHSTRIAKTGNYIITMKESWKSA